MMRVRAAAHMQIMREAVRRRARYSAARTDARASRYARCYYALRAAPLYVTPISVATAALRHATLRLDVDADAGLLIRSMLYAGFSYA